MAGEEAGSSSSEASVSFSLLDLLDREPTGASRSISTELSLRFVPIVGAVDVAVQCSSQ